MNAGGRLALYGAGLVVAFGGAFGLADSVIPDSSVAAWAEGTEMGTHVGSDEGTKPKTGEHELNGVSASTGSFVLSPIEAPRVAGEDGELRFRILDGSGDPVTEYTTAHEKDLHLIVVRTDGANFQHVHPELDTVTGTWSAPWIWAEAGTYRVYADFTAMGEGAGGMTLTRAVEVAGDFAPVETKVQTTDEVDGYSVSLDGKLNVGSASALTVSVERDGDPVTTLEPYLGAFGHLVALREGDLAYLHVHAEGEEPPAGSIAGPEIGFTAEAPTAGRYMLYLDFQVDGQVHTAEFVIDAEPADGPPTEDGPHSDGH